MNYIMAAPSLRYIALKALDLMRDMDWWQDTEWYLCEGGLEFSTEIHEFVRDKMHFEKEREREARNGYDPYDYSNGSLLTDDDGTSTDASTASIRKSSPVPKEHYGMISIKVL